MERDASPESTRTAAGARHSVGTSSVVAAVAVLLLAAATAVGLAHVGRTETVRGAGARLERLDALDQPLADAQIFWSEAARAPESSGVRAIDGFTLLETIGDRWQAVRPDLERMGRIDALNRLDPMMARLLDDIPALLVGTAGTVATDVQSSRLAEAGTVAASVIADVRPVLRSVVSGLHADADHRAARAEAAVRDAQLLTVGATVVALSALIVVSIRQRRRLAGLVAWLHDDAERLTAEQARTDLEMRLRNAFEMAVDERAAHEIVRRTLEERTANATAELHLADVSGNHLERVVSAGHGTVAGCPVTTSRTCPAVARGHQLRFDDSEAIDACPNLTGRTGGPCRAVCIPLSLAGVPAGVLHVVERLGEAPQPPTPVYEIIARTAADRIGMLRALSTSEVRAATDPLTGLVNRRCFEDRAQAAFAEPGPVTIAYGDLDHFKRLNDAHGHAIGDRALRVFARVVSEATRPDDIVARHGGEEFVLCLPGCTAPDALAVLARIRTDLAATIGDANVPVFTASFGVAERIDDEDLAQVLVRADAALLAAKRAGRDRDIVAGAHPLRTARPPSVITLAEPPPPKALTTPNRIG
jgi:diguanylate cyclase (GGDEF)-like protein